METVKKIGATQEQTDKTTEGVEELANVPNMPSSTPYGSIKTSDIEGSMTCCYCGRDIPESLYSSHINSCKGIQPQDEQIPKDKKPWKENWYKKRE